MEDMMNIYLLTQNENKDYDTFDSMVVYAESEEEAREIHPPYGYWDDSVHRVWASSPKKVKVQFLGVALVNNPGVILASFNAG